MALFGRETKNCTLGSAGGNVETAAEEEVEIEEVRQFVSGEKAVGRPRRARARHAAWK